MPGSGFQIAPYDPTAKLGLATINEMLRSYLVFSVAAIWTLMIALYATLPSNIWVGLLVLTVTVQVVVYPYFKSVLVGLGLLRTLESEARASIAGELGAIRSLPFEQAKPPFDFLSKLSYKPFRPSTLLEMGRSLALVIGLPVVMFLAERYWSRIVEVAWSVASLLRSTFTITP